MWFNPAHMPAWTQVKPESRGQSGRWQSECHDVMNDPDKCLAEMPGFIDKPGTACDTFVQYLTDNRPTVNTWPDAGTAPFRTEKNSGWDGACRVPRMMRYPKHIKAGPESHAITRHQHWFPTILALAGDPDIKEKLKKRLTTGKMTCKAHLGGHNFLPCLTGKVAACPRKGFICCTDDGDVAALCQVPRTGRFRPQGAVIVKDRNAVRHGHEIRAAGGGGTLGKVDDGALGRAENPGCQFGVANGLAPFKHALPRSSSRLTPKPDA